MSAEAITILSGVALLVVFVLVGWNLRRRARAEQADAGEAWPSATAERPVATRRGARAP